MKSSRQRVVFVGSFAAPGEGRLGGQSYACRTLLESPIKDEFDWLLIDSTQKREDADGVIIRTWLAALRIVRLLRLLMFGRVSALLIFTPIIVPSLLEKGLMCVLGKLFGKRVVVSLRSTITPDAFVGYPRMAASLIRYALTKADAFICQSQKAADDLHALYPNLRGTVSVLKNWIDVSRYRPAELTVEKFAARPAIILYAGLLETFKGIEELVTAVANLAREGLQIKLVVCGAGVLQDKLQRRIRDEQLTDVIELRGWTNAEAMLPNFRAATLFALPSHAEGMPNAVLEAMASGLPIVATRVGGIPELVADGQNGLLVPVSDVPALTAALRKIITSPELLLQMAQTSIALATEFHDIASTWPKLAALIRGASD